MVTAGRTPLLHHLQRCAEDSATQVAVGSTKATSETHCPSTEVRRARVDLALELVVCHKLGEFSFDKLTVVRLASET